MESIPVLDPVQEPSVHRGPGARGRKDSSQVVAGPGSLLRYPVIFTNFSHHFFMDPCPMEWGAHLEGGMPQEQRLDINLLKMRAVDKAPLGFSFPIALLRAVHILGKMNVIGDLLSRQGHTLPTEWSLNQEITRHLFCLWGSPHMDLFAARWNTKLSNFGLMSSHLTRSSPRS